MFVNESVASIPQINMLAPGKVQTALPILLASLSGNASLNLAGILSGDVGGSYAGETGSSQLDIYYFNSVTTQYGLALSQFGNYS